MRPRTCFFPPNPLIPRLRSVTEVESAFESARDRVTASESTQGIYRFGGRCYVRSSLQSETVRRAWRVVGYLSSSRVARVMTTS